MVRKTTTTTKYPGVHRTGEPNEYRIRAKTKDPRTGRTVELDRLVTAKSPRDAARLRDEAIAVAMAPATQEARPRLGPYARSWFLAREPALKRSTGERYASALDLHIIPAFGDWYLDKFDEDAIAAWRDGMTAAPATVNGRMRILRTLLEDAVPRYLPRNPAAKVRGKREAMIDREPNRLVPVEIGRVLDAMRRAHEAKIAEVRGYMEAHGSRRARVPVAYPMVLALVSTGMRWGEASALRWADILTTTKTIAIRRAQYRGTVDTTKTGAVRSVPLHDELAAVLEEHRAMLMATQHPGLPSGLVFPSTSGTPKSSASIRPALLDALEVAGVRRRQTVHGLRRTFNDLLRQVTSGTVLRSMTGHSSEAMTDHYSAPASEEQRAAVNRGFQVIRGGGE